MMSVEKQMHLFLLLQYMRYLYLQYGNVGLIDVNLAVNRIWIMIITVMMLLNKSREKLSEEKLLHR